jgi:hypothetical protein
MGDILQYLTIADVDAIEGKEETQLVYKTFLLPNKQSNGKTKTRRIQFDTTLPDEEQTPDQKLEHSYKVLREQGGINSKQELCKVNPGLFRKLKFMCVLSPDVLNPRSEDLERAFMLDEYDRAIKNPILDQEQVTRDFLLAAYHKSKKDPDKYFNKSALSDPFGSMAKQAQGTPTKPAQPTPTVPGQKPGLPAVPSTGSVGQ